MKAPKALTPELLKRILPALRTMVRFPTKPAKVVSFEMGIELGEIQAYTEQRGRPKAPDLDRIEAEIENGGPIEEKPAAPVAKTKPKSRLADYIEVCKILLSGDHLSESKACQQQGIEQGTWSYFKNAQFGPGPIARDKLADFLGRQGAITVVADSARNDPLVPPGQEQSPVPPHEPARPPAKARVVAPPNERPEISGKERRHLVASFFCGLAANPVNGCEPVDVILQRAYHLFDRLAEEEARRGGAS